MPIIADIQDKLQNALSLKMGYRPERDERISEAERRDYLRLEELPSMKVLEDLVREATTASFPHMLGTAMSLSLVTARPKSSQWWRNVAKIGFLDDFKTQDRIFLGEFGGVPRVIEGQAYTSLGVPPEFRSTYSPDTRGGVIPLTRQMLRNDDIGLFASLSEKAAAAAWDEFEKFFIRLVTGNAGGGGVNTDTLYDSVTLFHANHGNLGNLALDVTNLLACRARLYDQWLPGKQTVIEDSGGIDDEVTTIGLASVEGIFPGDVIRIGTELIRVGDVDTELVQLTDCIRGLYTDNAAVHADGAAVQVQSRPVRPRNLTLLHPRNLESTAVEVVASNKVPGGTSGDHDKERMDAKINIVARHQAYLGDDPASWYLMADAESVPTFVVDFLDGREDPEVIQQDEPTGNDDVIGLKIRHEYGGCAIDWRGAQANLVEG